MELRIVPATPETWPDVAVVMATPGDPEECWCQVFRHPREEWDARSVEQNRADLESLVARALSPGLVAYDGDEPVGWVSIAPIGQFPRIVSSPFFTAARGEADLDGRWSLTCTIVRQQARGQGLLPRLLHAAVEHARSSGATAVEGFPLDPVRAEEIGPDELFAGVVRDYDRLGFEKLGDLGPSRSLMLLRFAE